MLSRSATVTKLADVRREEQTRNRRVKQIQKTQWVFDRREKFNNAITFAAAAKACRTSLGVTGEEVAYRYGVSTATVFQWESGHYFGWNREDLQEYIETCRRIAQR